MDQSRKWNNLSAGFNSFEIFQNQKIHKSIFHFVFPDLFFSDRVLILLAAGNSWVRLDQGVLTIMRLTQGPWVMNLMHTSCDITSGHHKIETMRYCHQRQCMVLGIGVLLWMCKVCRGMLFSLLKGHSGFLFYMIYLELYNIAIADKHSSQLRLK